VEQFMRERGLELSSEKTVMTHIENGFDFLGQNVRKYQGKLLIKPSKDNVQELLAKVRKIVRENKQTPAGKLIVQLNPIIRGWALYHRHVVSKRTFNSVDHAISSKVRPTRMTRLGKRTLTNVLDSNGSKAGSNGES
jgi:RNA-directed DNA polymerase